MKPEWNKKYTTIAIYAFLVICAGALVFLLVSSFGQVLEFLRLIWKILIPFLLGFVIAYLINPLINLFERFLDRACKKRRFTKKGKRIISIIVAYFLILLFLVGLIVLLIPQLVNSVVMLAVNFPKYGAAAEKWLAGLALKLGFSSSNLLENMTENITNNIAAYLTGFADKLATLLPKLYDIVVQVSGKLLDFMMGFVISIYMVFEKEKYTTQLRRVITCLLPEKITSAIFSIATQSNIVFNSYIIGKLIDSLIVGLVCFIGMTLFSMPYALLISVVIAITNLIPYFGPFIGTIPTALIILIIDPIKALWFVVFMTILQQVDGNLLAPKILGKSTGISSFWTIFALLVFGGLFGIVGMFIGVPIFAVIYSLVKASLEKREIVQQNKPK